MLTRLFRSTPPTEDTAPATEWWRTGNLVRWTIGVPVRTGVALLGMPAHIATVGKQAAELVSQGQDSVMRIVVLVDAVEVLVADISRTAARAAGVVALADAVALDSAKVVLSAEDLLNRTNILLELYEPVLTGAHPTLAHAAVVAQPRHVDSVLEVVDLTPELLDLITPALRGMGELSPELGQLADRFESIGQIVEGLPGAGRLRRRGLEQEEQNE